MKFKGIITHYFVLLQLLFCAFVFGQSEQQYRLSDLKREIAQYRQELNELERKEASEIDLVENLHRQVDLASKLIAELKVKEGSNRKEAISAQRELETTTAEYNRLKKLYAKRLVYFYKHGRLKDLEILLSTKSINQAYLWTKYQQILAENDARNITNIKKKQQQISVQKEKVDKLLATQQEILKTKQQENDDLVKSRKKRKKILEQIARDKRLLLQQLRDYERSAREIQRLIDEEENRRTTNELELIIPEQSDFPSLKGRALWPVRGTIIKNFGKYKHPKLKTITQNLGIDIEANEGTPVKSVAEGIVSRITWMRGFGNLIMLNHYGGYYTVYAHLGDISVANGDRVYSGQTIGTVGESGTNDNPQLHFEIWENNKAVNPKNWLR